MREQWIRDGGENLTGDVLTNLYENNGVYSGSENYPTILDVMNHLKMQGLMVGLILKINLYGRLMAGLFCNV